MSEVTVSPLPDRLRDRVAPTRASPLARPDARTRIARGVRRRASARTADAPLDREPGGELLVKAAVLNRLDGHTSRRTIGCVA
ncbi:hypothetical protein QZM92_17095, partial [Burkholderia multivorans]|nr:hypothetical protein [Burkholderia multivorans]